MKKGFALIAIMMLVLGGCAKNTKKYSNHLEKILDKKEIVMVTSPDFAPYEFIDPSKKRQEQYVGADIALGKYIAEKLGVNLVIDAVDFETVLASITQGRADIAISGLGYKPDRAETMELSKLYNLSDNNCHGLLVKKEDESKFSLLADFAGLTVAAQNGSLQQGYTQTQLPNSKLELISSLNDGILMLQTGKVDAMATACTTGEQFAKSYDTLVMSKVVFDTSADNSGNVIGIPKGETELLEKINEIIDEVIELGLYAQWEKEYTEYADRLGV